MVEELKLQKQRSGLPEEWVAANTVLLEGEIGVEFGLVTKFKIGDGVKPWNALSYFDFDTSILVPKTTKINGKALSSDVNINSTDVGLGNVDNTSDMDKPLSSTMVTELAKKQNILVSGENIKTLNNETLLGIGNIEVNIGNINHDDTIGRNNPNQHDTSAITGLDAALANKAAANHNHNLNDLTEKSYNSLTNKPTLFSGSYSDLSNIPSSFTPSSHEQAISSITGLQIALNEKQPLINYTTENTANKENTSITADATKYPTVNLLKVGLDNKEDKFTKKTAFNVDFGTSTGTACQGNDSRLSDSRTPLTHNQAETTIDFTDVTTGNASITKHGFLPKLPNDSSKFLDGTGTFATPPSGGGGETVNFETLTADKVLTATSATIQVLTCTANRTVTLPTTGLTVGQKFEIWNNNTYDSIYYLTINPPNLDRIYAQRRVVYRWNGTVWNFDNNNNVANGAISNGSNYGSANGFYANGSNYGSANGRESNGSNYGSANGAHSTTNSKGACTVAEGAYSIAERNREFVSTASENFVNKAQLTIQKFKEIHLNTLAGAWQELFIDSVSARLTIIAKSVYNFKAQINAIDFTTLDVKTWEITGTIKRNASNVTSLVGTPTKIVIGADAATTNWDAQITADDTNESLKIEVKHNSTNFVRFSLNIFATETRAL